jgi:hypothetical protein
MLGGHVWAFSLTVSASSRPGCDHQNGQQSTPWLVSPHMASKALVIGLDCAAPRWVVRRWLEQLPTMEGRAMVRLAEVR